MLLSGLIWEKTCSCCCRQVVSWFQKFWIKTAFPLFSSKSRAPHNQCLECCIFPGVLLFKAAISNSLAFDIFFLLDWEMEDMRVNSSDESVMVHWRIEQDIHKWEYLDPYLYPFINIPFLPESKFLKVSIGGLMLCTLELWLTRKGTEKGDLTSRLLGILSGMLFWAQDYGTAGWWGHSSGTSRERSIGEKQNDTAPACG